MCIRDRSITTHHYPSLHITIHHYTSLPIITHHYQSLPITTHHYTSISSTFVNYQNIYFNWIINFFMMNHHKNNHNTVFNIISWNIQGLKTRLKPTHQGISNTKFNIKWIKANLSKFDVICLQETWAKDDSLTFEGYTVYSTIRSSKSKRGQGGVSVLIKNKHSNLVTHINSSSPNIIWCRLHKSLLRLESDIYLATVYSPPHISGSMDTTFSTI